MTYLNITNRSTRSSLCIALLLLAQACTGLPVVGTVGTQTIKTRVDSEAARYYLENYLGGERSNSPLDRRIDRLYQNANGSLPDRNQLKALSDSFSVDFASLYFADRVTRVPTNHRFRISFDETYRHALKVFPEGRLQLPTAAADYEILVVPIYLYKRLIGAGADLAAPRAALEKLGFACHFVETQDDGPIEANADLVAEAIRSRAQSGRRLIIISASKSSPEVALALTRLGPVPSGHVAAWINSGGVLQGTPLVDGFLFQELKFLVGGIDEEGKESLAPARSRQRFKSFRVPEHVFVVNYLGIPLTGNVSFWARSGFASLSKYGPNDGISLLTDMILPGRVTVADVGNDHFMGGRPSDITTVALVLTVIRWLNHST